MSKIYIVISIYDEEYKNEKAFYNKNDALEYINSIKVNKPEFVTKEFLEAFDLAYTDVAFDFFITNDLEDKYIIQNLRENGFLIDEDMLNEFYNWKDNYNIIYDIQELEII